MKRTHHPKTKAAHRKTVSSQQFALEPRLVFDGALLATATDIHQDSVDDKQNHADTSVDNQVIDSSHSEVQAEATADAMASMTATVQPTIDTASETATTIIIVDARDPNRIDLENNLPEDTQIIAIDNNQNGFQQISSLLQNRSDISALHIFSWNDGQNQWLGNSQLSAALDPVSSEQLVHWGDSFAQQGEVVFHGSNEESDNWLQQVTALTGVTANWSTDNHFSESNNLPDKQSLFTLDNSANDYRELIDNTQQAVHKRLLEWFQKEDYLSQLAIPFSANADTDQWTSRAQELRQSILDGSYSIQLEMRTSSELNGVLGAFSSSGSTNRPTIYLNTDWTATATPEAIQAVLLEELGHSFDNFLNAGIDSQGDEGQAFVGMVLYDDANLKATLDQDDHESIHIDGQTLTIESAAPYNIAQTFFVPMRESDVKTSLSKISTSVGTQIQTVISIVSTDSNTVVVYDQWEDGYEADLKNPLQSTTQIWGDGNDANGIAPGLAHDPTGLGLGKVYTLINTVDLAQVGSLDPTTGQMTSYNTQPYFDGKDQIGSTKAIAVTRAGWGITPGTVLAGSVNVYDTGNAGTYFVIPMGENVVTNTAAPTDTANRLFEYTSLHILATENNTTIVIDKDGSSTTTTDQISVTLNKGETYLVNGGVLAGATVTATDSLGTGATKAIEVYAIAGDVSSTYENRWFAITPKAQWASSYYAPVSTTLAADPTYVFIYNPDPTNSITVNYDTQSTTGQTIVVPANTAKYVQMPSSAAHFYTTNNAKFFAISTIDSDATSNQTHDWSYSLVPESYLTSKFVVAWGPGYNNTAGAVTGALNGSPVWVTSPKATTLYIDYAGDGYNTTQGDYTYNIKALESYRISDPDKDQSGLTVYTTDGTLITAAWGEDPSIAGAGNPYLDMGTTVMPFPDYVFKKTSKEALASQDLTGKTDGDGLIELGEQVQYTITVTNLSVVDLFNINIKDSFTNPSSATYVTGTTSLTIYKPDGTVLWTSTLTDGTGNKLPLDTSLGGYTLTDADTTTNGTQGLQRGYKAEFTYRVTIQADINKTLADGNFTISNNATLDGNTGDSPKNITDNIVVNVPNTDGEVFFYNSTFNTVATAYNPGDTIGLQVNDADQNKSATAADTLSVKVTNVTTGEYETVTLTETGVNTGIFRSTLATSSSAGSGNNNSTLNMVNAQSLKIEYTDPATGAFSDNPTNPGITGPLYSTGNANIKTAVVGTVPTPTDGLLAIYSDSGFTSIKTSYAEGDSLYFKVTDNDQNTNTSAIESLKVTVTNTTTGELETVTLTETAVNSGIFQGSLITSTTASADNSGNLQMVLGDTIQADYTDALFGATQDNPTNPGTNANRVTAAVTKIKILYLSADNASNDGTGDLDRVDPVNVSPQDTVTDSTYVLTSNSITNNTALVSVSGVSAGVDLSIPKTTGKIGQTFTMVGTSIDKITMRLADSSTTANAGSIYAYIRSSWTDRI